MFSLFMSIRIYTKILTEFEVQKFFVKGISKFYLIDCYSLIASADPTDVKIVSKNFWLTRRVYTLSGRGILTGL